MLSVAIRNELVADASISGDLGTLVFADGGPAKPAILTGLRVPEKAAFPLILITPSGGSNFGTRGTKGARASATVSVYGAHDFTGSLEPLAWKIWVRLDRARLVASGWKISGVFVAPPTPARDPAGFPGFDVSVGANVWKQ